MPDVKQYVPEFYEKEYGRTNVVNHSAEVLEQLLSDVETKPFNNWNDKATLESELHVNDIIVSGFKVRDISLLKAFFAFKGTNLDLQYILRSIGYDSVIYNDGGYVHRGVDGKDRVIPINQFYNDTISNLRCQIEIKVILDLNDDEGFDGYFGLDLERVKGICAERLNSCSYLSRVFIGAMVKERYETMKWTQDWFVATRHLAPYKDEYFTEYTLPEVIYGEEFNDRLRYGKEFNNALAYGRHKEKFFKPLEDRLITGVVSKLPEVAMAINGSGDATIQATEFVSIVVSKPHYDSYQFPISEHLIVKAHNNIWLTDEAPYPVMDITDSSVAGFGRHIAFIENPNAYYYGKEHNLNMKYGVGRGLDEFGNADSSVASYGDSPANQGTEHPAISLNGDNPNAVVQLSDNLDIRVIKRG